MELKAIVFTPWNPPWWYWLLMVGLALLIAGITKNLWSLVIVPASGIATIAYINFMLRRNRGLS